MRLATLIISLVLMLVSGLQACAVAVGGSVAEDLSTGKEKDEAQDIAGAGGLGLFAALLWLVGAGLVMSKPKAALYVYGSSAVLWLGAGAAGFSDGYLWMAASVVFAAMSWRGIDEKARKSADAQVRYQADVAAAAAAAVALQHSASPNATSGVATRDN